MSVRKMEVVTMLRMVKRKRFIFRLDPHRANERYNAQKHGYRMEKRGRYL